jgi:hypothetical protein
VRGVDAAPVVIQDVQNGLLGRKDVPPREDARSLIAFALQEQEMLGKQLKEMFQLRILSLNLRRLRKTRKRRGRRRLR